MEEGAGETIDYASQLKDAHAGPGVPFLQQTFLPTSRDELE